jgi:Protein of unknown function (DUF3574)
MTSQTISRQTPRLATVLTAIGLCALGACAAPPVVPAADPAPVTSAAAAAEPAGSEPGFLRTELYFGSHRPDGTVVSDEEFDAFVDKSVTPRFPDGLTQLTGEGQFRGSSGELVEERSFMVILLYPVDDADADREIEEIREDYKQTFEQESVLRADSADRVSF